jgi:hypothetical protein
MTDANTTAKNHDDLEWRPFPGCDPRYSWPTAHLRLVQRGDKLVLQQKFWGKGHQFDKWLDVPIVQELGPDD